MEQSDETIIQMYLGGQQEALNVLFERYKGKVFNFCLRILANRPDAEDATSDCFMAIISRAYTYQPDVKFSTWLFTVARNNCIDRIRKRKKITSFWFRDSHDDDHQWEIPDSKTLSREELNNQEMSRYVQKAIAKLPTEQKEALVLREYSNFSYEEIAQILNCSLEKVKILIFRAREGLRVELASFIKEGA